MNENINIISEKLKKIDKQLYIVGWFCRDKIIWFRGENSDIDLVTDATPDEIKKVLKVVWEVWKKYGTCIISEWWESFELTTFREDIWSINNRKPAEVKFTKDIILDSKRRDFTCNSIYFNPENNTFTDPQNGISDIENKIIRFVWDIEKRLEEDVLRILRFIRFKNKYNFNLAENNYFEIISKYTPLLKNISIERIKQELDKIMLLENNIQALDDLKNIWFFKIFIPEIDNQEKCLWNKWHLEWNVWIHTKMCIWEMNKIIKRENITDKKKKLILLWAIFLHDIWKAPTYSIWEDLQWHYYDHENIWAEIFKTKTSKQLLFSKDETKKIYFLIKEHIRIFMIPDMKKLKSRTLMMNKYFDDLVLIAEADNKGRIPVKIDRFNEIINIYNEFKIILKSKKFLTWKDIMEKYPELKWSKIWERLKDLNNQILVND